MSARRIVIEIDVALDMPPTQLKRAVVAAYLEAALDAHGWNRAKTARELRMPREYLRRMMKAHALVAPKPARSEIFREGNLVRWRFGESA